jgi:hypothetical protein
MCIGHQSQEHHRHADGLSTGDLDAARVRWHTYAVLCLDLLWGRDVREFCRRHGYGSVEYRSEMRDELALDFPALITRLEQDEGPLHEALLHLDELLRLCLSGRGEDLPADLCRRFRQVWDDLDNESFKDGLPIHRKEVEWRNNQPQTYKDWHPGDEAEVLVRGEEEAHKVTNAQRELRTVGRYTVVNTHHPVIVRREAHLHVLPARTLFLPGDLVPAIYRRFDQTVNRPVLHPDDWAQRQARPKPGDRLRALSLGRRRRPTLDHQHRADPWAFVEQDGTLGVFPIQPQKERQRFTIFPQSGRFFQGEYRDEGVIPLYPPDPRNLEGKRAYVEIHGVHRERNLSFFDFPMDGEYLVTCFLPRALEVGMQVPVRIIAVQDDRIDTEWDCELEGRQAAVNEVYPGRVLRLLDGRTLMVEFGDSGQFIGRLLESNIDWGIPFRSWRAGRPVPVRVLNVATIPGRGQRYELRHAGPEPARRPAEVFAPGIQLSACVLGPIGTGVLMLLSEGSGEAMVQAVGLLHYSTMLREHRQHVERYYSRGASLEVRVLGLDENTREIGIELAL